MDAEKLLELTHYHEAHCNHHTNGKCTTLRCMRRGGYLTGPFDFENPPSTCEERETAAVLREAAATISRLTAERDAILKEVREFVASWDWWQVDPVDRGSPNIEDLRALATPRDTDAERVPERGSK